jgi:hypothetical protein
MAKEEVSVVASNTQLYICETSVIKLPHGNICVKFTEVGWAMLFGEIRELCFVCVASCTLKETILSDSRHYHKQLTSREEKYLKKTGGKTISVGMMNEGENVPRKHYCIPPSTIAEP